MFGANPKTVKLYVVFERVMFQLHHKNITCIAHSYRKKITGIQTRTPTLEHRYVCGNLSMDFRSFRRAREMRLRLDKSLFDQKNIPPPLCKKGGATFRIKCDDDGYSTDPANPGSVEKLQNVDKKIQQQRLISSEQRRSFLERLSWIHLRGHVAYIEQVSCRTSQCEVL